MVHDASIRLPRRLVGVARSDAAEATLAAATPTPTPPSEPAPDASQDRQRLEKTLQALAVAAAALRTQFDRMTAQMRQAAIELAVVAAERWLGTAAQEGKLALTPIVQSVVDRLESRHAVTVKLHPDDLAAVQQRLEEDAWTAGKKGLTLVGDAAMPRGTCQASAGEVTAWSDFRQHLASLRQQWLGALEDL